MDDEKLIELVRENNVIYDMTHPKYMDPKFKKAVWKMIGEEMNATGPQCKSRWTNIRDHFRRYLKRKQKSEHTAEFCKKYKYDDYLQFLLPYTNDIDILNNSSVQETSADNTGGPNDAEAKQPLIPSSIVMAPQGRCKMERPQNPSTPSEMPSALMVKYILDNNDSENVTQLHSYDDIDTFLAGIASTMKKLNPYNQHLAKGRIFNIVHELEAGEFFSQPPYASNVASPHTQNGSVTPPRNSTDANEPS